MSHSFVIRVLLGATLLLEVLLAIHPHADRTTWALENFPVWIGVVVLLLTYRRFRLSDLCLGLFCLHALILMVGGYYTYAKVPLGFWMQDLFGFSRNHFDRLGHFAQGFVPAIFVRELLLRSASLPRGKWLGFLTVCVCLAFSACYEFLEWFSALALGKGANDFLGTQGDAWDTQWDMFMALVGAIVSILLLRGLHDKSLTRVTDPKS